MSNPKLTTDELYSEARHKWGDSAQVNMAVEEMGECIAALMQWRRDRGSNADVAAELADVEIMCEQLRLMFPGVEEAKKRKLARLAKRLEVEWEGE